MISWLFRKFWQAAPSFRSETQWNMEEEADAWYLVTEALREINDTLGEIVEALKNEER